jgi:DNA-binding XRE family transcriptional regulator
MTEILHDDGHPTPTPTPSPIRRSESIGALVAALAKAQLSFEAPTRSHTAQVKSKRTGATYSYHYEDLASVIGATRQALSENGLTVLQFPGQTQMGEHAGTVTVTTVIAHESGEYFESDLPVPFQGDGPQDVKTAVTYARRTAWLAVCGLAPEDDDANSVQGHDRPTQRRSAPQAAPPAPTAAPRGGKITAADAAKLFALAKRTGQDLGELTVYFKSRGWRSTTEMPRAAYDEVCQKIEAGTIRGAAPPADDFTKAGGIGASVFGAKR